MSDSVEDELKLQIVRVKGGFLMRKSFLSAGFALVWTLCGSITQAQEGSTWQTIQSHIFNGNCTNCHSAGTSFARQSDLILTADVAYSQLVDVVPNNSAANADGLLRVSSAGGPAGLSQSFLWEKINAPAQDHFYEHHPDYGSIMPLGAPPLTNGQLAFMESWILNGAPQTGTVANLELLDDTSRYDSNVFEPLPPPEQGIQLHLGPFDVWSAERHDREFYYFQPYETTQDTFVTGYEILYREGSHHFILYHYPDGRSAPPANEFRDLRNADGTPLLDPNDASNHSAWVVASQTPHTRERFPEGVALRLPPGSGFDLNVHSVNRTGQTRPGEIFVNLHTAAPDQITHVAEQGNFSNFAINLPPHKVTTLSQEFSFSETRNVISLWTHAHEHMVEFRVEHAGGDRDGELIYWTNDWEHPPVLQFDEPLVFQRGEKIRLVTTYNNETDKTIHYGPLSTDEMQFLFYVSYPVRGDFSGDGITDVKDIDMLTRSVRRGSTNRVYDINYDGVVSGEDQVTWVKKVANTYFGDANLDGEFNSADLVGVFQTGHYEDAIVGNSTWSTGDWDGNGEFDSGDFVLAFQDGGYERGPRAAAGAVPEPTSVLLLTAVLIGTAIRLRRVRC
jgi:hypothetical protein